MAGSTASNQGWLSSNRGPATLDTLPPIARVITVAYGDNAVAYPNEVMAVEQVVNDFVGGKKLVIFCAAGTASALDAAQFTAGRDVGAATAYDLTLGDQILTFYSMGGRFLDHQTGSVSNTLG